MHAAAHAQVPHQGAGGPAAVLEVEDQEFAPAPQARDAPAGQAPAEGAGVEPAGGGRPADSRADQFDSLHEGPQEPDDGLDFRQFGHGCGRLAARGVWLQPQGMSPDPVFERRRPCKGPGSGLVAGS